MKWLLLISKRPASQRSDWSTENAEGSKAQDVAPETLMEFPRAREIFPRARNSLDPPAEPGSSLPPRHFREDETRNDASPADWRRNLEDEQQGRIHGPPIRTRHHPQI